MADSRLAGDGKKARFSAVVEKGAWMVPKTSSQAPDDPSLLIRVLSYPAVVKKGSPKAYPFSSCAFDSGGSLLPRTQWTCTGSRHPLSILLLEERNSSTVAVLNSCRVCSAAWSPNSKNCSPGRRQMVSTVFMEGGESRLVSQPAAKPPKAPMHWASFCRQRLSLFLPLCQGSGDSGSQRSNGGVSIPDFKSLNTNNVLKKKGVRMVFKKKRQKLGHHMWRVGTGSIFDSPTHPTPNSFLPDGTALPHYPLSHSW